MTTIMFQNKDYEPSGAICRFIADVNRHAAIVTPAAVTLRDLMLAGFAFLLCCIPDVCSAQVVQLHTSTGKGTAVCIGEVENGDQLFVTVKHNFEDASEGRVVFKGKSYAIDNVQVNEGTGSQDDIACFTSAAPTASLQLYRGELERGADLELPAFGPFYEGRATRFVTRRARLDQLTWVVNTDQQVVPGDSGGPVIYRDQIVGLIRGYDMKSPMETQIVPAVYVEAFLKKCQWQCGPGGCYIRQRVRQPIAGIAIPIGPPQIETQIIPRPVAPQPKPDENFADARPVQGPRGERGPQGERGPAGPPGRDGKDGAGPDPKQVEDIVVAWLEANRDQLKGEPSERGLIGVPSEPELQAVIDTWVSRNDERIRALVAEVVREQLKAAPKGSDTTGLEKRLAELEKRPLKVVITEDGKVKDQESYLPGEPVVFDLARLRAK